jgi:hypothetical protein
MVHHDLPINRFVKVVCFELRTPAHLEEEEFYRSMTGDASRDNRDYRRRLVGLDEAHKRTAPYAHQVSDFIECTSMKEQFS